MIKTKQCCHLILKLLFILSLQIMGSFAWAGLTIYNPDPNPQSGGEGGSQTPDTGTVSISVSNGLGGTLDISAPVGSSISVSIGSDGSISFSSQSSGQYLNTDEIRQVVNALQVRPDTQFLSSTYVKAYSESTFPCPLTRLGLLGVSIGVADNVASSFYFKDQDLIILSKKEMDKYGLAVLDHELIHAGLAKAKKSNTISLSMYNNLSRLNKNTFSELDGYVGLAQGTYKVGEYAYQEAMAYGWGVTKLRLRLNALTNEVEKTKIKNFIARVYNNDYLRDVTVNGVKRPIYLIDSQATNVMINSFLKEFTGTTQTRELINQAQRRIKNQLPNLCVPKTQDIVFGSCFDYTVRICGDDMRWILYPSGCGALR